ncbi:MAG: hypothetical protein KF900_01120 [Bacteroidetes bacterium]|nr:hypothetical protein [Bacteroidota bacterium]
MKYLFIILALVFISACKRDVAIPILSEPSFADTIKGKVSAEINGKSERFFITTDVYEETFNFYPQKYLKGFVIAGVKKNLISQKVYNIVNGVNSVPKKTYAFFHTYWTDGDVFCENFDIPETDTLNNYIQITKQNNNYKEVFGVFSLTLIKTQDCKERQYPDDTMRIRNGYFHLYLK